MLHTWVDTIIIQYVLWTTFKPVQVVFENVFLLSCKVYENGVRRLETYNDDMQFSRYMQQLASTFFDEKIPAFDTPSSLP